MSAIMGLLSADVVLFVVTLLAGERIGAYAGLAWKWYQRIRAVKAFLSGGERARLSALEGALKAGKLKQADFTAEQWAVLTDPDATLSQTEEAE